MSFLPITAAEMRERGWESCDFVLVTGDAYVDHPSFGTAIISRVLEAEGYRVCILPQPQCDGDYMRFGRPRLAFLVNSGNIDSMVAHYTSAKRKRSTDAYSPGGRAGLRPDRALTVYCRAVRRVYPDAQLAIGGLEASLRRFAHYDYWSDSVMPSVLLDCGADLLMYGMGESSVVEIAKRLSADEHMRDMRDIKGTCYAVRTSEYERGPCAECPSYEAVSEDSDNGRRLYAQSCRIQQEENDAVSGRRVIQRHGGVIVVQNPPMPPLDGEELDRVYELPYEKAPHPSYEAQGGVPGIEEVRFSLIHNRGCFGACNFCALAYHQGRRVTSRTIASVVREAERMTASPGFKGYIHDVGGPTANFRRASCEKQLTAGLCKGGKRCLSPTMCPAVEVDHTEYLELLRRLRELPGVKRVFVRSGVRFDYLIADRDETFFKELVKYHVSGQLKVAPEHCSDHVLELMGKPKFEVYRRFKKRFYELTEAAGKKQYLVPYMISSHPGSTVKDAVELAVYLKRENMHPEQVQDFYPTPGTVSTCMFYTGLDPFTMERVFVPKTREEKAMQRALLQYYKPENAALVRQALRIAHRTDLIGSGGDCLVRDAPRESRVRPDVGAVRKKGDNKLKNGRHSGGKAGRSKPKGAANKGNNSAPGSRSGNKRRKG